MGGDGRPSNTPQKRERGGDDDDEGRMLADPAAGVVVRALSLAGVEVAGRCPEVKGVIWGRGPHRAETDMENWVSGQEESREPFAYEQVLLTPASAGGAVPMHPWADRTRKVWMGSGSIPAACARAVARLPEAFRDAVRADAAMLCGLLTGLCPDAPWLSVQVEIIGRNACVGWHQDRYVGRLTITYAGPGTWLADDSSVRFDEMKTPAGGCTLAGVLGPGVRNMRIVPRFEDIHRSPPNGLVLLKGNYWPGIVGPGLTHKAPDFIGDDPVVQRLMLNVDLSNKQPGV